MAIVKTLIIFDFDDTLVKTGSRIYVTHASGKSEYLTPGQYAVYKPKPGDEFDYGEFEQLVNPQSILKYNRFLIAVTKRCSTCDVVILTARGHPEPVAQYLKSIGITSGVRIKTLDSSNPIAKKNYVRNKALKGGYTDIVFYDDSYKNISAVESLGKEFNGKVRFHTHLVPSWH